MTIHKGRHILVVDDDPEIVDAIVETLNGTFPDASIHPAISGLEAVTILKQTPIDVAMTDGQMPGLIDGFTLIKIIRGHGEEQEFNVYGAEYFAGRVAYEVFRKQYQRLPIIMVSGDARQHHVQGFCMEHDVHLLGKPVNATTLTAAVRRYYHSNNATQLYKRL
ncbi:response regulator [Candidatus Woesearchaeota archaeon]|nr:response regulator [Candidatus Woesearchaeota archaeon]